MQFRIVVSGTAESMEHAEHVAKQIAMGMKHEMPEVKSAVLMAGGASVDLLAAPEVADLPSRHRHNGMGGGMTNEMEHQLEPSDHPDDIEPQASSPPSDLEPSGTVAIKAE